MTTTDATARPLRIIRALIAQADDPASTPSEAETFRAQADALMFKYRIDLAMAREAQPTAARAVPVWATIVCAPSSSEFEDQYVAIVSYAAHHAGCKTAFRREMADGTYSVVAYVVGFAAEVAYAELLATSAMLGFSRKLEPKVDRSLGDDACAYVMRHAGWEGRRIAHELWGNGHESKGRSKARAAFAREAVRRGEDPTPLLGNGNSVKVYRTSYATAFVTALWYRLSALARDRAADQRGLVLASSAELVAEALYERFPYLRPAPADRQLGEGTSHRDCAKCAKAQRGYCRDHAYLYVRNRPARTSQAGREAGAAAARSVDLGGARGRVTGADRASLDA